MIETMSVEEMAYYKGLREVPEDFDDFWRERLASMSELPSHEWTEKDYGISGVSCYELRFTGANGSSIYSKVILPKNAVKVPIIFHFHGYQGRSSDWVEQLKFVLMGYGVVAMDVRGQAGNSTDAGVFQGVTVKGQVIRGMIDGPEYLFYKDIYTDVYQLIELVASLPQVDEGNLMTYGASQGGALALIGGALSQKIKKVVAIYPFLSDFPRILQIGYVTEPYDELFRYFKFVDPLYKTKERVLSALDYIDVKNFAHLIRGEVKLVTGLRDEICPPSTQFAIYNRLNGKKEQIILPEYGHEALNVAINDITMNWLTGTKIEEV